ncbi:MAG TPA: XdhC family protein [Rhizomicrobium sp.]|nr:XdhC family protein [Rhizomicrobium sp.]
MRRETLRILNETERAGRALVRATRLANGEETLIDPVTDRSALGVAAADAARADQSAPVEVDGEQWFLEVHNPPLELVVVGAAHIAQPLIRMALLADYRVRVIDPRTSFATPARFPDVAISHDWPDEALARHPLGARSALVALTHDPKVDDPALVAALRSNAFYIGALGSRKNHAGRIERLKQHGFDDDTLARIRSPVGLAIGARSPAEIAISILAEMTQTLRAKKTPPDS